MRTYCRLFFIKRINNSEAQLWFFATVPVRWLSDELTVWFLCKVFFADYRAQYMSAADKELSRGSMKLYLQHNTNFWQISDKWKWWPPTFKKRHGAQKLWICIGRESFPDSRWCLCVHTGIYNILYVTRYIYAAGSLGGKSGWNDMATTLNCATGWDLTYSGTWAWVDRTSWDLGLSARRAETTCYLRIYSYKNTLPVLSML